MKLPDEGARIEGSIGAAGDPDHPEPPVLVGGGVGGVRAL